MASIRDVAKKANVGSATVSRVLNNSGYVSEETREKIENAMEELNYIPNELARNLFHKKTGIIAVLVPSVANPFFAEFVECIESELYTYGYKTMLCNTVKEGNAELEYLDMLNRHIVDGVITGVHSLDVEVYKKIHKPIVALDRFLGEDIPVVAVNHKKGGKLAAEELLNCGCKSVLQFCGSKAIESPYLDRHTEFAKMMKKSGVEVHNYELEWNRFDADYYEKVMKDVFSSKLDVDGVFGVDQIAIRFLNETRRRNIAVPDEIKIVAYDGTFVTGLTEPRLTVIAQPIDQLAKQSARLISRLVNGKTYRNKKVLLDAELKVGNTTRNL
ncbi:LacI family DNA-binding transcriptional regulator [Faecalimonas umbilicata]|uniref:LacI family DNA-binding transcriptional regulator n=1 Tax=Faecalimonas umbilicata TaxID=1912855 RepID=UPI000E718BD7|nr:LacI family DNA-binding transcriptional regulator [Faecalimonas umbilicata]RJV70451.1 LacI family transcriptional regulator [Coprococcus sp. AF27-8]